MKADDFTHTPVLTEEVLDGLDLRPAGLYIDATFGRGGHSMAILKRLNDKGRLLVFDKDPVSIRLAENLAATDSRVQAVHASFSEIDKHAAEYDSLHLVDGILFDLGVSSPQLDDGSRGFSFMRDGELDMRMNPNTGISAAEWVNSEKQDEIVRVLKEYGEERFARRIARKIVETRVEQKITHTKQLAELITQAVPGREKDKHPATRSFQAIRIFINSELEDLREALAKVDTVLAIGGRLAVISFHSLEDRIVKRYMREMAAGDSFPPDLPVTFDQLNPKMKLVGKAIKAGRSEVERNPRARSAVLRIAEKLAA
ncbi:MAG: 16S rRNA (cytosine(1402)-N(4))-methyltransferase RsmH [Gammaproteobacteria bacterium]|nr:16S rRNA (cytosine(1402)-N(4))-methyltransferase RsmH [Gammaproteobacteria bacterium]